MVSSNISTIMLPLLEQLKPASLLIAGETARLTFKDWQDTRTHLLNTPFQLQQFDSLATVDVAVISDLTETLTMTEATQWLGMLKNRYTQHILILSKQQQSKKNGWELADFLALGFKLHSQQEEIQLFYYAIESYQPKRDWLNARFWSNPENFDKYRW